jgi:hypothetical protein
MANIYSSVSTIANVSIGNINPSIFYANDSVSTSFTGNIYSNPNSFITIGNTYIYSNNQSYVPTDVITMLGIASQGYISANVTDFANGNVITANLQTLSTPDQTNFYGRIPQTGNLGNIASTPLSSAATVAEQSAAAGITGLIQVWTIQ